MKETIAVILSVVAAWAAVGALFAGIGLLIRRAFGLKEIHAEDLLLSAWCGWGGGIVFLQLWHCFFPVDWRALAIVAAVGFAGLAWNRNAFVLLARNRWKQKLCFCALLLVTALWLANQTTNQPQNYDSGLYHLIGVRWAYSYPIVPGLALLHLDMGGNSSFWLYAAMLDIGPFARKSHHLASGLLILFVLSRSLTGAWKFFRSDSEIRPWYIFDMLFFVPTLAWMFYSGNASSPSPDVGVFLLGVVLGSELIRLLHRSGSLQSEKIRVVDGIMERTRHTETGYIVMAVIFLAAIGLSVKVNSGAVGIPASLLALAIGWRAIADSRNKAKLTAWIALIVSAVIVPLMARNVILTGYPLWPASFAGFPMDWKIPAPVAQSVTIAVKAWARMPGADCMQSLNGWDWLLPWVNRITRMHATDVVVPLAIAGVALALIVFGKRAKRQRLLWSFLIVPAGGIAFCFLIAPNPKFAGAAFWLLGIGLLTFYLSLQDKRLTAHIILVYSTLLFFRDINLIEFFRQHGRDIGPAKTVPMKTVRLNSGLEVFMPVEGDQCWDAPLPCARSYTPALRLRVAGNMAMGFTLGDCSGGTKAQRDKGLSERVRSHSGAQQESRRDTNVFFQ